MNKPFNLRAVLAILVVMLSAAVTKGAAHSGSLPVIYITSETLLDDINREEYVPATYYLDNNGVEGVKKLGSPEAPLPLQVRGRGNWSWVGFDKKPYRLLLDTPAEMCGLKESDYFGLHAHADDNLGFMRNTLGFELARRLGIDWTPSHQPVEIYFNGEYQGMYFCTELVRVDPDRVNVYEQPDDDNTDVTGGWLVEIDNYDTDPHITLTEGNGQKIIISHKTPASLSPEQEEFLTTQMTAIDEAIYDADKTVARWADYIDMDRLARFYIVHELMDNTESFHGSCFMHRDRGEDSKWMFGPVWDFGSSFFRGSGKFIWEDSNYTLTWIKEICKFPDFQQKVKDVWAEFCAESYDGLDEYLQEWAARISGGAASDYARWPEYGTSDIDAATAKVSYMLANKARWLGQQWGAMPDAAPAEVEIFLRGTFNTWGTNIMFMPQADGTYTVEVPSLKDQFKIASADFSTVNYGGDGVTELQAGQVYHLVAGVGGKNISVSGEIKDAVLTFDPMAQTLLVEGEQLSVDEPDEVPVYFRGDMNTWLTDMPFEKSPDGIYRIEIQNMTGRFKIADDGFKIVNLGGDNVTLLEADKPYQLIQGGKNISLARDFKNARLELDLDNKLLTLTDLSDSSVVDAGMDADAVCRVFNMQGIEMPASSPLASGVYIFIDVKGRAVKKNIR